MRKEIEKQSDTAGEVTGTKEQLALFTNAKLQMLWEKKNIEKDGELASVSQFLRNVKRRRPP